MQQFTVTSTVNRSFDSRPFKEFKFQRFANQNYDLLTMMAQCLSQTIDTVCTKLIAVRELHY